ncbi:hypothetical protein JW905_07880 [bacterium]|nr:hypothetical protein [candidate division CSSED10-310 bacterium]
MGTLQYLLAPAAMIWSGILLFTRKTRNARLVVGPFCLTNVASIASMLYRGYLND